MEEITSLMWSYKLLVVMLELVPSRISSFIKHNLHPIVSSLLKLLTFTFQNVEILEDKEWLEKSLFKNSNVLHDYYLENNLPNKLS